MDSDNLEQMIDYIKNWKTWLESVKISDKDEVGKKKLIDQMNEAITRWEEKLQIISEE